MDAVVFAMKDPECWYSFKMVVSLLADAEKRGFPLEAGSYVECMTIRQLDALLHGKYDA